MGLQEAGHWVQLRIRGLPEVVCTTVFVSRRRLRGFSNMEELQALHLGKSAGTGTSRHRESVLGILEVHHSVHTPLTPAGSQTAHRPPEALTPAQQRPGTPSITHLRTLPAA